MFDHIAGQLVRKEPTEAVVRSGGVGYHFSIPVSTYEELPREGDCLLYTHMAVSDSGVRLYGFATEKERQLFRILVGARGVGPAIALAVMSGSNAEDFARAVLDEDFDALSRIRGIGKKTARRLVAEIAEDVAAFSERHLGGKPGGDTTARDAVTALVSLGLSRDAARRAVERVRKRDVAAPLEELVRAALSELAG